MKKNIFISIAFASVYFSTFSSAFSPLSLPPSLPLSSLSLPPSRSSFSRPSRFFSLFFVFVFLFFSISISYASFLTSAITRLQPAAAVVGSAGSKIIPAVFTGNAAAGSVSSWISLALPGGVVAKVAGAVVGVAGALALDYVFNNAPGWFVTKNLALLGGGIISTTAVTYPAGSVPADYPGGANGGMYTNATTSNAACQAVYNYLNAHLPSGDTISQCTMTSNSTVNWYQYGYYHPPSWSYSNKFYYPKSGVTQSSAVSSNSPVQPATVQALLTTDLAANNASAVAVGQAALEVAAAALDNPNHPLNMQAAIKAAYEAALLEGVTPQQKTDLEAQATVPGAVPVPTTTQDPITYLTPAQIAAAVQAALAGQGLSAAEIAKAIAAAQAVAGGTSGLTQAQTAAAVTAALAGRGLTPAEITAATSAAQLAAALSAAGLSAAQVTAVQKALPPPLPPDPVVTEPTIVMPDKKNLTTVMGSFMTAINSLPMMDTLRGMTINVSGSSQLCLDLPVNLGGQKCFDGGRMQGGLNMIG